MIAIRLAEKNRNKILQESPIDKERLDQMLREYDTEVGCEAIFFVPQSDIAHELNDESWMTIPWRSLLDNFDFDKNKIDTDFVQITQK